MSSNDNNNNGGAAPAVPAAAPTPEQAVEDAFTEGGVQWKASKEAVLAKLRETYRLHYDPASGGGTATGADGKVLRLTDVLRNFSLSDEGKLFADQRSVRYMSREDFPDEAAKIAFLAQPGGLERWTAMPAKRQAPLMAGEPKSFDQYLQLPRADRMKLMADPAKGPRWLESLPRR